MVLPPSLLLDLIDEHSHNFPTSTQSRILPQLFRLWSDSIWFCFFKTLLVFSQDGVLCCSYNYHCGDDTVAVGFDGVVATTAGAKTHEISDFTKQYSAALRVANSSAGVVYVSDSMGGNKTEQTPPGG